MELGMATPSGDLIKCCDCGCDSSKGPWIRSVKRRHEELENEKRFSIPELDDLKLFSNPKVQIENECDLLRETVSNQQETIQELYDELEKQRSVSSTAADEAMSMILRLQSEKAEIQMELRQYKVYAGEKIEHDQQEISELEDLVYQREQTIQALTYETQAYKQRMMSYGLTEAEADGEKSLLSRNPSMIDEYDHPTYDYPPSKCNINEIQDPLEADIYVADDENYPPADSPHGREHLKTLDLRISQMETNPSFTQLNGDREKDVSDKVMVGQSSKRQRHFRRISTGSSSSHLGAASKELRPDVYAETSRSESYSSKKVEIVSFTENNNGKDDSLEIGHDMNGRVYTIDSVHQSAFHSGVPEQKVDGVTSDGSVAFPREQVDLGDPDITKLYMRLQALEADRESMKQALVSMRTEKAQMVLLKEIAQHLSKEVVPRRRLPLRKASVPGPLPFTPVFKWITSFVSWKRKARRSFHNNFYLCLHKLEEKLYQQIEKEWEEYISAALQCLVGKQLLECHISSVLDKGFTTLMDGCRTDDLQRMYILLSRVNALAFLRQALSSYIRKTGKTIVMEKDRDMVQTLVEFKTCLETIWTESFSKNESFRNTIKDSFEHLINLRKNLLAELIAKLLDEKLRAGNKGTSTGELENTLEKVLALFGFIQGKEVFESFYLKDLAKRLLQGKSASIDAEKFMISKLKKECGIKFTNMLEGMIKDILLNETPLARTRSNRNSEAEIPNPIRTFLHEHGASRYEKKMIEKTKPCSDFLCSTTKSKKHPKKFMFWDVDENEPEPDLLTTDWTKESGTVRNQRDHDICWAYAGLDLYSARRVINEEDHDFRFLSARYLAFYASEMLRGIEKYENNREGHLCHGYSLASTLRFIRDNGVPEEDPRDAEIDFSCVTDPPERSPALLYHIGKDLEVRESKKLKDLYEMLLEGSVGADLHVYQPVFEKIGSDIYEGPTTDTCSYSGRHVVLIVAIIRMNGKLVAKVKSSHGTEKGDGGYVYVSLTRMVMGIGTGNDIYEPTLLLTDFTGLVARPEESGVVARPESEKNKKNKKRKRRGGLQSETALRCLSPPEDPSVLNKPELDVSQALRLKGTEACKWFARQLMLPEWMIDVPDNLSRDWYVLARPAGQRCFVVSSEGTTVSRVRNGSILHHFPSALPGGARKKGACVPARAQSYSILDCIFHEADQTYYVIDMVYWKGYSLYECTAEFRLVWLESKLAETGACDPPSVYHKFRFSAVPFNNCDQKGLHSAYTGTLPYVKDGLLFYNKHAHYHTGKTPQVLIWKDDKCSQYVIDTDSNGEVPNQQHVSGLDIKAHGCVIQSPTNGKFENI